jgi:hypothetical protein
LAKHRGVLGFPPGDDPATRRVEEVRYQAELLSRADGDPFRLGLPQAAALAGAGGAKPGVTGGPIGRAVLDAGGPQPPLAAIARTGGVLGGTLHGLPPSEACCEVAVARAGVPVAAGPIFRGPRGRLRFSVFLAPEEELSGDAGHGFELYRIDRSGALQPLRLDTESAQLELAGDGSLTAVLVDGQRYAAGDTIAGFVEQVVLRGEWVRVRGWALDRVTGEPADWVVLFLDGEMVASGPVDGPRPDVALDQARALESGFEVSFTIGGRSEVDLLRRKGLVVLAVSGDRSSRLDHVFAELRKTSGGSATVVAGNGREVVVGSTATRAWVEGVFVERGSARAAQGHGAGTTAPDLERLFVVGWAADVVRRQAAERVVAFDGGRYVAQAWPGLARDDVAAELGAELRDVGFSLELPRSRAELRQSALESALELVIFDRDGGAALIPLRPELFDEPGRESSGRERGGPAAVGSPPGFE